MSDRDSQRATMDRLIGEIWNNRRLDLLHEMFTEDATLNYGAPR